VVGPAAEKPLVLFVDDEDSIRDLLARVFEKDGRFAVHMAADGEEGLQAVSKNDYSLVVTDLQMPKMGGLSFIRRVHQSHPNLPFIVFTGFGEMDDAIEALRLGALNFLRKPWDLGQIIPSIEKALASVERTARRQRVYGLIDSCNLTMTLPPRLFEKEAVIQHLTDPLVPMNLVSDTEVRNVYLALDEVLNNSIVYGALEIDAAVREGEGGYRTFQSLVEEREKNPDYRNRMVRVSADYNREEVTFQITDPGDGFDHKHLPDPTDPENLMKEHGRGLLLVQCFMDEVRFNRKGNEVILVKRRRSSSDGN